MKPVRQPVKEDCSFYNPGETYLNCISIVRNRALREDFESILKYVLAAEEDYLSKVQPMKLHQINPEVNVLHVSGENLRKVYTFRMVPKTAKGRLTYDRILAAPENSRCPFCGIGTVNTLDHYLPKGKYPVYSVMVENLVACCEWCQGEKGEYAPDSEGTQLLHPYFDDLNDEVWHTSDVVEGSPAAFKFGVVATSSFSRIQISRLKTHLKELGLYRLYSQNAGGRLTDIRARLTKLHEAGGMSVVRSYLEEELKSFEEVEKNSWLSAMYRGAIESDWFCDGGFKDN